VKKLKLWLVLAALVIGGGVVIFKSNVVEAHTRTVRIKVDKNGFSPSSIEVEAGHKLNLIFNRADNDNCGRTVVFRRPNLRKALPLGKDVLVTLTPRAVGRITFTCGMGMYKGSILVSEE
jgi:plastocyanin domain-containing protein